MTPTAEPRSEYYIANIRLAAGAPDTRNNVGHTDSDGDDAANLDLSRRRAAAVRGALAREFAIDTARMDTDGKGEAQPVDTNDTPAGKANNRRVEFTRR